MNLTLDEKERRSEMRCGLSSPGNALRPEDLPRDLVRGVAVLREWQRDVYDAGLVGHSVGRRVWRGAAATAPNNSLQISRWRARDAPELIGESGSTWWASIVAHGTPEQKRAYVKRMLAGETSGARASQRARGRIGSPRR